jgi:hypothetical protein
MWWTLMELQALARAMACTCRHASCTVGLKIVLMYPVGSPQKSVSMPAKQPWMC